MEGGNVEQLKCKRQDSDCTTEKKRCNVERQRKYIKCLKTPEKKTKLLEYRQNRAVRKRELRKKKTDDSVKLNCDSVHEFEGKKYRKTVSN